LRAYNAAKCTCGTPLGSIQCSPRLLADFKGTGRGRERRKRAEGRGREERGRDGEGERRESWNRAADWLRPALLCLVKDEWRSTMGDKRLTAVEKTAEDLDLQTFVDTFALKSRKLKLWSGLK